MVKRLVRKVILLVVLINCSNVIYGAVSSIVYKQDSLDYFSIIIDRISIFYHNENPTPSDAYVMRILTSMKNDGSYPDIDYTSTEPVVWSPISHLDRARNLVLAYTSKKNKYNGDKALYKAIINTLNFWNETNSRSTSWYKQQVAVPNRIGIILILMRYGSEQIPDTLERALISRMKEQGGDPNKQSGANKMDVATHWIYRGCLTQDNNVLEYGVNQAFSPLSMTAKEGFQHDYSFHQHGRQLYIGGYGTVMIQGVIDLATFTSDTPYALTDEQIRVLGDFILNGYLPSIRGKYFLYTALGRGISRPNALLHSGFSKTLSKLIKLDPDNKEKYECAIERLRGYKPASYGITPFNRLYWRSDYMVHQRPSYTIGVRMSSTHVARVENGDGENLKGYFLSDGAMCIAIDGDEYSQIFPVWDWTRIPGVTAPVLRNIPLPKTWGYIGKSTFSGGVSDGEYGIAVYQHTDYDFGLNIEAKKSYFFFDEEVLCLGAGINSSSNYSINTTINQTNLKGSVIGCQNGESFAIEKELNSYTNLSWILHNNVVYYFPDKMKVLVSIDKQSGSQKSIRSSSQDNILTEDVFKLCIDHGVSPQSGTYSYIILPKVPDIDNLDNSSIDKIEVLRNDKAIQAVRHNGLDILALVFYEPGNFLYQGINIEVTKRCALIFRDISTSDIRMYIGDPSKIESNIDVAIKFPSVKKSISIDCKLKPYPNPYAGSSQVYFIRD